MFDLMANPEAQKYLDAGGDEKFRFDYPLNEKSLVLDIGAFEGDWAIEIWKRYKCEIWMFEPLIKSAAFARHKFKQAGAERWQIIPCAVSDRDTLWFIDNQDSGSSFHIEGGRRELVSVVSIKNIIEIHFTGLTVDIMKINVEGEEYNLIECLIKNDLMKYIKYLQVQFHEGPSLAFDAKIRYARIRAGLEKTHEIQWEYPFVWESWKRK
jgi:FkbM family methyltransferase